MSTNLTPDQHGSKNDLQAVKEVIPDNDDCRAPCGPAFTRANGFDAWGRCKNQTDKTNEMPTNLKDFAIGTMYSSHLSLSRSLSFARHLSPLSQRSGASGEY